MPWFPFYIADYDADTSFLTFEQHGAYLSLICQYYRTGRPLPANAQQLYRICRANGEQEKAAIDFVLSSFFYQNGDPLVYRHKRIDAEISKALGISEKRSLAAKSKSIANGQQLSVHTHTQAQAHGQEKIRAKANVQSKRLHFSIPSLGEVTAYCQERGGKVDPQSWFDHYTANGWKVGRNPMKDWRAAVRQWERSEFNGGSNERKSATQLREERNKAKLERALRKASDPPDEPKSLLEGID